MTKCNNCNLDVKEVYQRKIYSSNGKYKGSEFACTDCFPKVKDKWIKNNNGVSISSISLKRIPYEELEIKVKKLEEIINLSNKRFEEELDNERNANLEMLDNLRTLNEQKFNERLEIALKEKTQRIEFLEKLLFDNSSRRKLELLEEKLEGLIIERN